MGAYCTRMRVNASYWDMSDRMTGQRLGCSSLSEETHRVPSGCATRRQVSSRSDSHDEDDNGRHEREWMVALPSP